MWSLHSEALIPLIQDKWVAVDFCLWPDWDACPCLCSHDTHPVSAGYCWGGGGGGKPLWKPFHPTHLFPLLLHVIGPLLAQTPPLQTKPNPFGFVNFFVNYQSLKSIPPTSNGPPLLYQAFPHSSGIE